MILLKELIKIDTHFGDPIIIRDNTDMEHKVVLEARSMTMRWSFGWFVWNRPIAIIVEQDDEKNRIPIIDTTRLIQLSLVVGALILGIAMFLISIMKRKK